MKKLSFLFLILFLTCTLIAQEHAPVPFRSCTKWGFVEYGSKKKVTNFEYDSVDVFAEGMAWVKKGNLYGYIDEKGGLAIPIQYDEAYNFEEGYGYVEKANKGFYVDFKGKEHDFGAWCRNNFIGQRPKYDYYKEGSKVGLSNNNNYEREKIKLSPAIYDKIIPVMFGAFALKNGKWAYINENKEGDIVWDSVHLLTNTYRDGYNYNYFAVCQNNKWALLDFKGNVLISFKYQAIGKQIDDINETTTVKPFNADWGFIDMNGVEYFEERGEGCLNERIDYAQDIELTVNPNPFSEVLNIYFNLEKDTKTLKISLSDISGKIVYEETLQDYLKGKHEYTFTIKDIPVGVYVLHLDSKEGGSAIRVQKY